MACLRFFSGAFFFVSIPFRRFFAFIIKLSPLVLLNFKCDGLLLQELSEHLGIRLLNERLSDPGMQDSFDSIFPKDNPKNTRFAINFFTSIGLGGITENLREYLKNMPRLIMQQQKAVPESDSDSDGSGSDSDGSGSSSESSSSESSESESDRDRRRKKRRRN